MPTPEYYLLKLSEVPADIIRDEVTAKKSSKASAGVFKDAIGQSIASVEIPVGKARAPRLHTNTSEIVSVTQGTGRVGLLTPSSGTLNSEAGGYTDRINTSSSRCHQLKRVKRRASQIPGFHRIV